MDSSFSENSILLRYLLSRPVKTSALSQTETGVPNDRAAEVAADSRRSFRPKPRQVPCASRWRYSITNRLSESPTNVLLQRC
jgi:hypothetical protein